MSSMRRVGSLMNVESEVSFANVSIERICSPAPNKVDTRLGTKVICTLGPKSSSVPVLAKMLRAGMSVARFDFSYGDHAYHQRMLDNLRAAMKKTGINCATMLDTRGPELVVLGYERAHPITLTAGKNIRVSGTAVHHAPSPVASPYKAAAAAEPASPVELDENGVPVERGAYERATSESLTINWPDVVSGVPVGAQIFIGPYLYTGSETSSAYLEVVGYDGDALVCKCLNDTVLGGAVILTVMVCNAEVPFPVMSARDEHDIATWGKKNKIDYLSLSFTRSVADVQHARQVLARHGMEHIMIIAKIENLAGLNEFDNILSVADGIVFSRGNLGMEVREEKMFRVQKHVIHRCNEEGKPVVITRVVDSMVNAPRPTRAEATDVANAVLDGCDAIMLGAETTRGIDPVMATETLITISQEARQMYDHNGHYVRVMDRAAGGSAMSNWNDQRGMENSMSEMEALASSAVRAADKSGAKLIICYTRSGNAARLLAKYKPPVPVLTYVVPTLHNDGLRWQFRGDSVARQMLIMHGLVPVLADPSVATEEAFTSDSGPLLDESIRHAVNEGLCTYGDTVVVSQKLGRHAVVQVLNVE